MTEEELCTIAEPILVDRLANYGFDRFSIRVDRGLEDEPIFQLLADVDRRVPIDEIVKTGSLIAEKAGAGEYVFLNARTPQDRLDDEALDEGGVD